MRQAGDNVRPKRHIEGRYSDYFEVGHSPVEFIVDCGQFAGNEEPTFHTRLVITPARVFELIDVLRSSVDQYEASFGTINRDWGDYH